MFELFQDLLTQSALYPALLSHALPPGVKKRRMSLSRYFNGFLRAFRDTPATHRAILRVFNKGLPAFGVHMDDIRRTVLHTYAAACAS